MADLYDYPDIYDERFTDRANQAYKEHYQKMFAGKEIHTLLDCSFGTGNLTFPLAELGQISARVCCKRLAKKPQQKDFPLSLCHAISGRYPLTLTASLTA